MKKNSGFIVLGLLAMFIGLILSTQIKLTSGDEQGALVPLAKVKGYESELAMVKAEKETVTHELMELEARLSAIESEKAAEDAFINGLVTDLEKYKLSAGVVDVEGPGVLITIKDPISDDEYQQGFSTIMYNYDLLLSLVNKLKEAGAEAICINEQRIAATTEISIAGTNVNINGTATAPPYYVKAIGNPDTLNDAINIRSGIIETMKIKYNLVVSTQKKDSIAIPRYTGAIKFKYAEPVAQEVEEE